MIITGGDISTLKPGSVKRSAAEEAYDRIREMIVTGVLSPGQIIKEMDLIEQLEIGRTPIREAIQRLERQHVLEVFPRRGIAVAKLSLHDVQSIFEARETIEKQTAMLAAVRHSQEEADALLELGEKILAEAGQEDYSSFLRTDQLLHHLIASAARNWLLAEYADHLLMLSDWVWHQYFQLRGSDPSAYFAHEDIIAAIVARDGDLAGELMQEHVQHSRDIIRSTM